MRGEERKTPRTSPSGACEAASGGLPGPLRPRMTVCLLPSLEVTHPPAGTMATGKQSHPCGSSNSCGLGQEGQAPSTPTAPAWASLCPPGLHPTRPQPPLGPPLHTDTRTPWAGSGDRQGHTNQLCAAAATMALRLRPSDYTEAPAVLLPASVHFAGAMGGAKRTTRCHSEPCGSHLGGCHLYFVICKVEVLW